MNGRPQQPGGRGSRRRSRGMAVLIVLILLSVSLALCYAMMHTESAASQLARNSTRRGDAQVAAATGLSIALRQMHDANWAGVVQPMAGQLNATTSYAVTFETGDAELQPTDPEYAEFPYRVTVTATGTTADPTDPSSTSSHRARAVVQLVRKKLHAPPASWTALQDYTVAHLATESSRRCQIEVPCRIDGHVRVAGELRLCYDNFFDGNDRPFSGTIDDVAILGSALSAAQVADLHAGTLTLDDVLSLPGASPVAAWRFDESDQDVVATDQFGNHPGVYDGATPAGGAATFDGINDQVHAGIIDVSGSALTLLAWLTPASFDQVYARIISKATGVNRDDTYWMLSTGTGGGKKRLRFRVRTDGGTKELIATSGNLTAGVPVFAAAVYDGAHMQLYKDGVLVGSTAKTGSLDTSSTVDVSIGNCPPGSPRARYLRDLRTDSEAGGVDARPFGGRLHAPQSSSTAEVQSLVIADLATVWQDDSTAVTAPVHPGAVTTYRLYPGGKEYSAAPLTSPLKNGTWEPDVQTNPLGLFVCSGTLRIEAGATVRGTIVADDTLELLGAGPTLQAVALPHLSGAASTVLLPVAQAANDFRVKNGAAADVLGVVICGDDFEVEYGTQATSLTLAGKVVAGEVKLLERSEWNKSADWWATRLREFLLQLRGTNPQASFPWWLETAHALSPQPKIVIGPDAAAPAYHLPDWSQPIFVADPADGGLRWQVVRWEDNPDDA